MEVRVGDYGYDINFSVVQADGKTPEDLTSVLEVRFQIVEVESHRNIVNGVCQVTNPAQGKCKYTVNAEDFKKAGNYVGGLKIKYSADKVVTTKDIFITVKKALK